jgi:predicted amidohydrolase
MDVSNETAIAASCMNVVYDKKANLETYRRFIDEAAENSVRLLVFPECSTRITRIHLELESGETGVHA